MSNNLNSLLTRVERSDKALADELRAQIEELSKRREFGLNFEKHRPETVELYGRAVRVGDKVRFVAPRGVAAPDRKDTWVVQGVKRKGGQSIAALVLHEGDETAERAIDDIVVVADFRDPIYPGLSSTGKVECGGDKPFHAVINSENYHALEAMLFTYQGKVDAIYIDPPYNTRDKDWKYNNDYVDSDDDYKHSKWLSFMERRLKMAKKLLNPVNSVLIVTIDEKEYLRLGLLLEQTFPSAKIQMISSVINPKGTGRVEGFRRVDEYIFVARIGAQRVTSSTITPVGSKPIDAAEKAAKDVGEGEPVARVGLDWQTARRRDLSSVRRTRPSQFYPIYVSVETGMIDSVGEPIPHEQDRDQTPKRKGCVTVFPVRDDGTEMNWGVTAPTFVERWKNGYARAGKAQPGKPQPYIIQYLKTGPIKDIEEGRAVVEGRNADGSVIAYYEETAAKAPPTHWNLRSHNAEHYGTKVIRSLLPGRDFPFPKSLYAVEDVLRLFVGDKPDALIVDFFGGSGTTTHATMRLNKQDGGRRRSIVITNNEVSDGEEAGLREDKLRPGDDAWEALGICNHITKPRIRAAITGLTPADEPVKGSYKFVDEFPMSDGFEENVEFFDLTYEDPMIVGMDLAFSKVAPLLWMRAGSEGRRIDEPRDTFDVADTYAVLFSIDAAAAFRKALHAADGIRVVYIVTDEEKQFQMVAKNLPDGVEPVRLYESYLRTFEINTGKE